MKPNKELIRQLCFYLGELDYIIDNSKDYREKSEAESRRKTVHELLELPYKPKESHHGYYPFLLQSLINKLYE